MAMLWSSRRVSVRPVSLFSQECLLQARLCLAHANEWQSKACRSGNWLVGHRDISTASTDGYLSCRSSTDYATQCIAEGHAIFG